MRASRKTKRRKTRERKVKNAQGSKKSQTLKTTSLNHNAYDDADLIQILKEVQTIALVGASNKAERPSNQVLKYLQNAGYEVAPINPGLAGQEIAGQKVYAELYEIEQPIDMIDIFRKSDAVQAIVNDALKLSPLPKVIWMQLEIEDAIAAKKAEAKGVRVVMNRCPKIEYERLKSKLL